MTLLLPLLLGTLLGIPAWFLGVCVAVAIVCIFLKKGGWEVPVVILAVVLALMLFG